VLTLDDLHAAIARDIANRNPPLAAYWYECTGDRGEIAHNLAANPDELCLVPLVVRKGFDSANALLNDLAQLLEEDGKQYSEMIWAAGAAGLPVALVLLSRTRLDQPQVASPIRLPDWFPCGGGTVVNIVIVDLQAAAAQTLGDEADSIRVLQTLNFEIQGAVLQRLAARHAEDQNNTARLFAQLLQEKEAVGGFLSGAAESHARSKASEFRVSTNPKRQEMLGRLIFKVGALSPEQLPAFAEALFGALGISDASLKGLPEPFAAVALRSTIGRVEADPLQRTKRNVILTLYFSSQLVTAAAHSAEYGLYNTLAMRGFISDCQRLLESFRSLL
jgi:hypothetical protein